MLPVAIDSMAWHRMYTACEAIRKMAAENPAQRDLVPDHEAAVAWPLVTAAYNGIEQALKMLLLAPAGSTLTLEESRKLYGHDLEALYSALAPDDQAHIELHFGEHWSLYELAGLNLGFKTVEEFVAQLNDSEPQQGSIAWRYALLDMSAQIPQTNPWTMCEVWYAICCCIKKTVYPDVDDCFRLSVRLAFEFGEILPRRVPYDGFTDDLNLWVSHAGGSLLAAWVELLVQTNRDAMSEVRAPERLRPVLASMAATAAERLAGDDAGPDEQRLLTRIQRSGRDLVWDPQLAQFH